MVYWIALIFGIILNASANILMKVAANYSEGLSDSSVFIKMMLNPYLLLGVVSFGLALGAYSYSLSKFDLSVAYPLMTSLGLIIVALFSVVIFKENFSAGKIFGTILILLGVIFFARAG